MEQLKKLRAVLNNDMVEELEKSINRQSRDLVRSMLKQMKPPIYLTVYIKIRLMKLYHYY
jgi:hypothetical protein